MNSSQESVDAIVVGGGISGLSAAWFLRRNDRSVKVFEKKATAGGVIRSRQTGPYLLEEGPNTIRDKNEATRQLLRETGLDNKKVKGGDNGSKRYILRDGHLHPVPLSGLFSLLTSPLISTRGLLRMLVEPFIPASNKKESVAEFVERRLGREVLDYFVDPFMAGVYSGSPDVLSMDHIAGEIKDLEQGYGSVLLGSLMKKGSDAEDKEDAGSPDLLSFPGGLSEIPETIASELSEHIVTTTEVLDVQRKGGSDAWKVTVRDGDRTRRVDGKTLVIATPAEVCGELLRSVASADQNMTALPDIPYAPMTVVHCGFESWEGRPLDGFGFLVPRVEERRILGAIWNSALFPGRAPGGGELLTVFVGGGRQFEYTLLSDKDIRTLVRRELKELLRVESRPDLLEVTRWEEAIPQYKMEHGEAMKEIQQLEEENEGLRITGNFRKGVSVPGCISRGKKVAKDLDKTLQEHARIERNE